MLNAEMILKKIESQPELRFMFSHWLKVRHGSVNAPFKNDLDLFEMGPAGVLPYVWLIEPDGEDNCRFRLVGDEIRNNFVDNPLNKDFIELYGPEVGHRIATIVHRVLKTPGVHFSDGVVRRPDQLSYNVNRLMLPLRTTSDTCGLMLGVISRGELQRAEKDTDTVQYVSGELLFSSLTELDDVIGRADTKEC